MFLIKTTSDNIDVLRKISKKLIKKNISKCNQISRCESLYEWDGKINCNDEFILSIKAKKIKKVYKIIKKHHNYECFEFIYHKISCSKEYLKYLKEKK